MEIQERKNVLKKALTNSFVDDYISYKNTIDFINNDLLNSNINFQYSYDEFCVEFLNQTLKNIEDVDIFDNDKFDKFYAEFWKFNLYNLQCMLIEKLNELGYKYDEFYDKSKMKKTINKKSI